MVLKPCQGRGTMVVGFLVFNLGLCILCDTAHFKLGVGVFALGIAMFCWGHLENYLRVRAFDKRQSAATHTPEKTVAQTVSAALIVLGLLLTGFAQTAYSAVALSPTQQIQDVDSALKGWHKGKKLTDAQKKENDAIKRRVITQDFDLNELSRLALGGYWTKINADQRKVFVSTFTNLLLNNAILHSEKYNGDETIEYVAEEPIAEYKGRIMVKSKISVPEEAVDFDVHYAMIFDKAANRWRIYDLILDEESLMQNYHDQFAQIISKHSYAYLVDRMKKKLGEGKSTASAKPAAKAAN